MHGVFRFGPQGAARMVAIYMKEVYRHGDTKERRQAAARGGELTRRELAIRAGVTEKTVWNYETGELENARYGAAKRIAHALGVLMEDLEEE